MNLFSFELIIRLCGEKKFPSKITGSGQGGCCVAFIPMDHDIKEY